MRIRNKKWAVPELNACPYFLNSPGDYKNRFNEFFGNNNPIHLELGCGKGLFTAALCTENPNINYIAIDIKSSILGVARRNIEKTRLEAGMSCNNICIFAHDIERLPLVFGQGDRVDRIYLNFPNPWEKPRHHKKRLTHQRQLALYRELLTPDGQIWFKTDDDELFFDTIEYLIQSGFIITYQTVHLKPGSIKSPVTEHQRMFEDMGIATKFLIAERGIRHEAHT